MCLMQLRAGRAIHHQAEQFRSAVVAGAVHQDLSCVNQRQVQIGYYLALAGAQRLAQKLALRRMMAVKLPPEIGPIGEPVSAMICAC